MNFLIWLWREGFKNKKVNSVEFSTLQFYNKLFTSTYGSLSWDGFVKVITMIGTKMVSQTKWQQERIPAGTMQSSLPTPHLLLCKTTPDKGFLNLRCYLWFQSFMETVRCGSIFRMVVWMSVSVIKPFSVNTHYASIDYY